MKNNYFFLRHSFILCLLVCLLVPDKLLGAGVWTYPISPDNTSGLEVKEFSAANGRFWLQFPFYHRRNDYDHQIINKAYLQYTTDGTNWYNLVGIHHGNGAGDAFQDTGDWYRLVLYRKGNSEVLTTYPNKPAGRQVIKDAARSESDEKYLYDNHEFFYNTKSSSQPYSLADILWEYNKVSPYNKVYSFRITGELLDQQKDGVHGRTSFTWNLSTPFIFGDPQHKPVISNISVNADGYPKLTFTVPGFTDRDDMGTVNAGVYYIESKGYNCIYPNHYNNRPATMMPKTRGMTGGTFNFTKPLSWDQYEKGDEFYVGSWRQDTYVSHPTSERTTDQLFTYSDKYWLKPYPQVYEVTATTANDGKIQLKWKVNAKADVRNTDGFTIEWAHRGTTNWTEIPNTVTYNKTKTDYEHFIDLPEKDKGTQQYQFRIKRKSMSWTAVYGLNKKYYADLDINTNPVTIKSVNAGYINGNMEVSWSNNQGYSGNNWYYKLIALTNNGSTTRVVADEIPVSTTKFVDGNISPCTPTQYKLELYERAGSTGAGTLVSHITMNEAVVSPAVATGEINRFSVSKGYHNDRVNVTWRISDDANFSKFTLSRKLRNNPDAPTIELYEIDNTKKLYSYEDRDAVPGIYYDYTVTAWSDCDNKVSQVSSKSSVGFSQPFGVISGRIAYEGSRPVQGVSVVANGESIYRNKSILLNADQKSYIATPYVDGMLSPAEFTFQAWVKPTGGTAGRSLITAWGKYNIHLLEANNKLELQYFTNDENSSLYRSILDFDLLSGEGKVCLQNDVFQHLSLVYRADEKTEKINISIYLDGKLVAVKTDIPYPEGGIGFTKDENILPKYKLAAKNLHIGRGGDLDWLFEGYMDELRIWKKALTAEEIVNNYDRYISGKENGLTLYYRFDEPEGNEIFDLSNTNGVYNEHHGTAFGGLNTLRSEHEVPSAKQLAIKAITDDNGHYIINTVPYTGDGNSFTVIPMFGVHEFQPSNRPLFFSNQSSTHNNVDFTDVSSFNVSGKVVYAGGNYPVEGCQFKVDGRILVSQDGKAITTDANGEYKIEVPIGIHELKVEKAGHTFLDGGLALNNGKNINYQNTITGLVFHDITRVKVIGHIVGGKREHDKTSGFGERINNIGADILALTAAKSQYLLRTTDNITPAITDTTFYHSNGEWKKAGALAQDSTRMSIAGNAVTIHVSPSTGEYVAWLYPEMYTIENISVNRGTPQNNTIYDRRELLDLTDAPVIDDQMLKTSVRTWIDSVYVSKKGNQEAHWKKEEKSDTVKFHKEWSCFHQATPSFTIQQTDNNEVIDYFGDKAMQLKEDETVTFYTETDGYTFEKPVFTQGKSYKFYLKAFEQYENKLSTAPVAEDTPPVANGTVNIMAGIATEKDIETITLDDNGEGTYEFIGGDPDLTSGVKYFNARLIIDGISYLPTNMTNGEMRAYVLGGCTTGTDFLTAASDKVDFVLHDPPGSESYAFLEKGSVHTLTETTTIADGVKQDASLNVLLGVDQYVLAGVGLLTGGSTEQVHKVGVQEEITSKWINGNTVINTSVFAERISTSPSTDFIGHAGDIFVGTGNNMLYGLTNNLDIKKKGDLDPEDVLIEAGDYVLGRTVNFSMGLTFATRFYYTESEIENIMIPKWQQAMQNIFVFSPTGIDVNTITEPVYVSNFSKEHPDFAKPNNHPDFGDKGKELKVDCGGNCLKGESYDIYFPAGFLRKWLDGMDKSKAKQNVDNEIVEIETLAFTDTVAYYYDKINTWEKLLAANEKAKVDAHYGQNYSFGGGVTIEKSEAIESTVSTVNSQTIEASLLAGGETGFNIFGSGLEVIAHAGWVRDEEHTSSGDETETTLIGFVLQEDGALDELTVDFGKDPQHGTFVFRTRGGRTACPYEGEVKTKYYNPGQHILSEATMRIEVPRINVAGGANRIQVPSSRPASFTLNLTNESETRNDGMFRLVVDEGSNPDGAIVKIDGLPIGNGRLFMVPHNEILTKTLTIEKGPDADKYENIRLLLVSDCQFDLTDLIEDVFDDVYVNVEFTPSCTDAKIIKPVANWITNTVTGDTLEVEIGGFDINYANFDHIDLQFRLIGSPDWNTLTSFFADQSRFDAATGIALKEMIPAGAVTAKYKWNLATGNVPDGQYEIRVRSICSTPAGVIVSECESEAISGVKDMSRPMPLGNPSPVDGIFNTGSEISILFNEDIQTGLLTKNNFNVSGILNADKIAEPNVGLAFDGTGKAFSELPLYTNGSFSIETWYQRKVGAAGTLFAYGSGNNHLSLGFDASGRAVISLGNETHVSTAVTANDETWKYITLSYNHGTNSISVYGFQGSDPAVKFFEDKALSAVPATQGKLYIGNDVNGNTGGLQGAVGRLHFYNIAHTVADASLVKHQAKAGNEPNLIGYWELTEGEGSVAKDKAASRDLVLNTGWYVYPSGKSLAFNGGNQYATIPSATFPFRSYDDFSIEFWFRGGTQGRTTLLSCGDISVAVNTNKQLELVTNNGTQVLTPSDLLDNQWHHMALSVKRNGNTTCLIDGVATASFSSSLFAGDVSTAHYYMGVKRSGDLYSEYFNGNMDEIRIWRAALTNGAIRLNKNNKLRGDEPGLVAYYPFEKYTKQSNGLVTVTTSKQDAVTNTLACGGTANLSDISPAMQDCRPVRDVPFEFTASNNKVVINLTVADYLSEGVTLTVTSKGIRDMRGNVGDPVTWTAYMNRNALKWDTDDVKLIMAQGEQQNFKAVISNRGGENIAYYIENIPVWLSLSNPTGNLKPLENKELTFNVQQGINVGNYETSIVLTGANSVREILPVHIKVTGQRPGWAVNPSDFESSMNITGQVKIEGIYQEDEDDILAAFIGDLCVGVASPKYIKSSNAYFSFADIYGNKGHNNKELTFKYWDASTGRIYPKVATSKDVIKFGASAIVGSIKNPVIFDVLDMAEQRIELNKGWNWVSSNVINTNLPVINQMKNSLSDVGVMIKSRNAYIQQPNWLGGLTGISEKEMYLVNINRTHNLLLEGKLANPAETPLSIKRGWNWIGYIPSFALPLNNALAGINAQIDDHIKGQTGYAIYVGNDGWIGSLTYMQAGEGYMYYSNNAQPQTLLYPSASSVFNPVLRTRGNTAMKWSYDPSQFSTSMTATLIVSGITSSEQIEVAAFCGNECRGSAFLQHIEANEAHPYLGFLMIYGNPGDVITFKVYDHATATEHIASASMGQFVADEMYGTPANPEEIVINPTGINEVSASLLQIYPNPVKDKLHFSQGVLRCDVLEIMDINGRVIIRKIDFADETLDVSYFEESVYLMKVIIGDEVFMLKFIKE